MVEPVFRVVVVGIGDGAVLIDSQQRTTVIDGGFAGKAVIMRLALEGCPKPELVVVSHVRSARNSQSTPILVGALCWHGKTALRMNCVVFVTLIWRLAAGMSSLHPSLLLYPAAATT